MGRPKKDKSTQLSLFNLIVNQQNQNLEVQETVKFYISTQNLQTDSHNALLTAAIPPASILDVVANRFKQNTDIPLEIPFFIVMHFLSAYLVSNEITVDFSGKKIECDIWSVILASSGAGKTFSLGIIEEQTDIKTSSLPSSSAAYIPSLNKNNRTLIVKDEFAQLLKSLKTQPYMEEMKEYLLQTYDNKPLERVTKKSTDRITKPVVSLLGMTALESFAQNVSLEDMLDGFAQRFSYVIAKKDPNRKMIDFPLYHVNLVSAGIKEEFENVFKSIKHKEYVYSDDGLKEFYNAFSTLAINYEDIPESFFRRISFRVVKYAVIYHIILKKENNIIDKEDFTWASRIMVILLINSREMINQHDKNEFYELYQKCKIIYKEKIKERGYCRPSDLVQYVGNIKSANEAKSILSMLESEFKGTEAKKIKKIYEGN